MDLRVSIALLTRDRPESLSRALASLRAQSAAPWEIVVSDDSDDPAAAAANRAATAMHDARWQPGPRRGLYANRNAAARACAGTHVRAMDDDHTLPPGHLAVCAEAVARDPRALWTTGERALVGGRVRDDSSVRASQLGPAGLGEWLADDRLDDNWAVSDGSTTYPREVFDLPGGGFVETWAYGQSYLEFGAWLYARGWRSRCVPGAMVEHHEDVAAAPRSALSEPEMRSRLFAILCWHRHFRGTPFAGLFHLLNAIRGAPGRLGHLQALPGLARLAAARWRAA